MAQTFEEMCAERDPLYAALNPIGNFAAAVEYDKLAKHTSDGSTSGPFGIARSAMLWRLAVRALRNQGQPYYDVR